MLKSFEELKKSKDPENEILLKSRLLREQLGSKLGSETNYKVTGEKIGVEEVNSHW